MHVVAAPRWLTAAAAASALGVAERTLRHRAAHGQIDRRRDGARTLYLVTVADQTGNGPAMHNGNAAPDRQPAMPSGNPAIRSDGRQRRAVPLDLAPLVDALVSAERRAAALDAQLDQVRQQLADTTAELARVAADRDQVRAAGAELERRHVKRGALLRQIAQQLGAVHR